MTVGEMKLLLSEFSDDLEVQYEGESFSGVLLKKIVVIKDGKPHVDEEYLELQD